MIGRIGRDLYQSGITTIVIAGALWLIGPLPPAVLLAAGVAGVGLGLVCIGVAIKRGEWRA